MARRSGKPPIARILIRDNVSVELAEFKKKFSKAAGGLGDMSFDLAGTLSQGLTDSLKLIGVSVGLIGGSFIATTATLTTVLGTFAKKGLQLKSTAESLNLSIAEFKRLVNLGVAQGLSTEQATADIIRFANATLDLRRGVDSTTRAYLEEQGTLGSGTIVSRQLYRQLERDGDRPYNIMLQVLQQMQKGSTGTDEEKKATEIWRNAFGLGSPAWNQAIDNIDEFGRDSLGPAEDAAVDFLMAQLQVQLEAQNLQVEITNSALPAFEAITKALGEFASPEKMDEFGDKLGEWLAGLNEANWDEIRGKVRDFGTGIVGGLGSFLRDVARAYRSVMRINAIIARWQLTGAWTTGKAIPYLQETPPSMPSMVGPSFKFIDNAEQLSPTPKYTISPEYMRWQRENAEVLSGEASSNIEDRRNEQLIELRSNIMVPGRTIIEPGQQRQQGQQQEVPEWDAGPYRFGNRSDLDRFQRDLSELGGEFNDLYDLIDIDKVKLIIGRTPSGDGGVSEKSRTPPLQTPAGGARSPEVPPPPEAGYPQSARPDISTMQDVMRGADPLTRLGLSRSQIGTFTGYRETLVPGSLRQIREEETMRRTYGFAFTEKRQIYYDETERFYRTTLAHEGGHVGRHLVQEAGKKDPTLRGYGASLGYWKLGPKEELAQRHMDIDTARKLYENRVISREELNEEVGRAREAINRAGPFGVGGLTDAGTNKEDAVEYARHNKMYQDYAARMMQENFTDLPKMLPQRRSDIDNALNGFQATKGKLDLEINVSGPRGTSVEKQITDGTLMSDDDTTITRELQ